MADDKTHHTFLSHSHQDREDALGLVRDLKEQGYKVWISHHQIEEGDSWPEELDEGLNSSLTLTVYWTKAAAASKWVGREITKALQLDLPIIPILFDDTQLNTTLVDRQPIEGRTSYYQAVTTLMSRLNSVMQEEVQQISDEVPWTYGSSPSYRSRFLENNSYLDRTNPHFAANDISQYLTADDGSTHVPRFLTVVAVPVPDPLTRVDLDVLINKSGLIYSPQGGIPRLIGMVVPGEPWRKFDVTALDQLKPLQTEYLMYKRAHKLPPGRVLAASKYLRFTEEGALEYGPYPPIRTPLDSAALPVFHLAEVIEESWKFVNLASKVYDFRNYHGNFQLLVNLRGTAGTILGGFGENWPDDVLGVQYRPWAAMLDREAASRSGALDGNMQFVYTVSVDRFVHNPNISRDLIDHLSQRLQNSFGYINLQNRHYAMGTTDFPWRVYA